MAEKITLTVAEGGATANYLLYSLTKERGISHNSDTMTYIPAQSFITVRLAGEYGKTKTHTITGVPADDLIRTLNKGNHTTTSESTKIMNWLIANVPAVIAGTISGTPD